jgi:hypothetical protein
MNHRIRKSNLAASSTRKRRSKAIGRTARLLGCFLLTSSIILAGSISLVEAQSGGDPSPVEAPAEVSPRPMQPSAQPQTFALPNITTPTVAPAEAGQYVLEFNRSPVVGSSLRLQSIYDEARLRFTRPRNWEAESVKVLLRFRHSAALYASRSNLTVLVNNTSVGSVPLNKPQGEIGSVVFDVPTDLIQDHNEVVIAALQNNSPTCTQDPYDPSLWTEILPDSKVVFDYEPQPIALDFSRYPFPVYDTLSLQGNQLAYLLPETIDETWLTATSRYHTSLGRIAEYRSLDTRLISSLNEVEDNERLVVIGTPAEQPDLANLDLPLPIQNDRILDAQQQALPPDVGVLMLATAAQDQVPVLIATGNSPEGVAKAAQFLAQSQDQKIGTGSVIYVNQVTEVPTPSSREWAGYLPLTDSFQLSDLRTYENQSFQDVTVRGSHAPALEFDFRALPDDQFLPGSSMVLRYSYSPQVNPVTSLVEVELDNIPIDGRRLSSVNGATQQEFRLDLPDRIRPDSKMQINFRLDPRERRACSRVTDQQLWGTIHADTSFSLNRQNVVNLPNLDLFRFGYPFASPQDLSTTAIVIPDNPTAADLELLLETSERLGRLSKAESVKLNVYRTGQLPPEVRSTAHLIGIGTQAQFPFPEAFQEEDGFNLNTVSLRQWQQSQIQSTPDEAGVAKQIVSPWNSERVLLALSSQSPEGLGRVRELLAQDPLFYQLQGDTVLISANTETPSPYDANDYNLQFLSLSPQQQIIGDQRSWWLLFRSNWLVLAPALVLAALLLYGVSQLYLQRVSPSARS